MSVYIDTSALFAILDADDEHHKKAKETWLRLVSEEECNYVLYEENRYKKGIRL